MFRTHTTALPQTSKPLEKRRVGVKRRSIERILVVEGQPMVRFAMARLLDRVNEYEVVGEAGDGEGALRLIEQLRPGLVILGLDLSGELHGVEVCWRIKSLDEPPRVLIYTSRNLNGLAVSLLLPDADSYQHASCACQELADTVRRTAAGERVWRLEKSQPGSVPCPEKLSRSSVRLSKKEREIASLVMARLSNSQIAEKMHISLPTVKTHVKSVMRKLDLSSRWDLA